MRKAVMPVFVESEHLDWYVTGGGVLLEMVQDRPAEHVGQRYIQRYRGGMKLPCERQAVHAAQGNEDFEPVIVREVAEDAGIVHVVLDDQQDCVALLQVSAIVFDGRDVGLVRDQGGD